MTTRTANTHWEGSLKEGKGRVSLDSSGVGSFDVDWPARAENPGGLTSPEELIAAAHSSCFAMALSNALTQAGHPPTALDVRADVTLTVGTGITGIQLTVRGSVPELDRDTFDRLAADAKANCPVSKALSGVTIDLDAELT